MRRHHCSLAAPLGRIYDTPGVIATRSYVVLSTYLERSVQPAVTSEWAARAHAFGTMGSGYLLLRDGGPTFAAADRDNFGQP